MRSPKVSVVMGVHNGGDALDATLDSVLSQEGVDLEFLVVDDGSTDGTAALLARRAEEEPRLRVLTQPRNRGLTEALIRGCAEARGEYLARQDAGDRSLPGRLRQQAEWLDAHPEASMVSSHTRNLGLYGEVAYERRIAAEVLEAALRAPVGGIARGPSHHGSVMMRATAYCAVGGYRQPFVVAQDIDLWLRLVEVGQVGVVDAVLYESQLSPTGITAGRAALQAELCALAVRLAKARREGGAAAEQAMLESVESGFQVVSRRGSSVRSRKSSEAAYLYFLGRCVRHREPDLARRYYRAGIARCPWHLRSWYGLAASLIQRSG